MLCKFAVTNYRGFEQRIEWDLTKARDYAFNTFAIKNKINDFYDDLKMNFEKDENIKNIIDEESLIYLKEGKRIKSIIKYNYYEDKRVVLKILSQINFVELGYLLCGFDDFNNNELKDLMIFFW